MRTLRIVSALGLLGAFFATACADGTSPNAPTTVSPDGSLSSGAGSLVVSQGKGGNGNGNGNGNGGNGSGNNPSPGNAPAPTSPGNPVTGKVEIEGLIATVGAGSLTVNGQVVLVSPTTVIRHGSRTIAFADLRVGDRVHVTANKMQDGTLQATEVKVQNPGDGDDGSGGGTGGGTATVTVEALDAFASESAGDTGTFRLTRVPSASQPVTSPLTVTFSIAGSAQNGTDYQSLPTTATFAAGQTTVDLIVTPVADGVNEGPETVIVTLTNVAPYVIGTPATATVTITDLPAVTVTAVNPNASETGPVTGTFRLTRNGGTAAALTVGFTLDGTAQNGVDYVAISSAATFPVGQATVDVVVTPIKDQVVEGPETVILSLVDGQLYDLGTPNFATVTITD